MFRSTPLEEHKDWKVLPVRPRQGNANVIEVKPLGSDPRFIQNAAARVRGITRTDTKNRDGTTAFLPETTFLSEPILDRRYTANVFVVMKTS